MNGYFNNLAIRTVSRGNLVEPRIASMYEPQGVMESSVETVARPLATNHTNRRLPVASAPVRDSVTATPPVDKELAVNAVATTEETFFEPTVPEKETAPSVSETPQHREPQARTTEHGPVKTQSATPNEPAPAREVLVREHATVELPETRIETTAVTPPRTTSTRRTIAPQPKSVAATPATLDPTAPESQVEKSIDAAQPERSGPLSVKSVVQEATTTSTHHFSERLVKQTHVRREQTTRTRREHLLLEAPPDAEPSINVTIGRIEVRATPAPAAKQKPGRTASPVMPLEDYLRQQRRGDER